MFYNYRETQYLYKNIASANKICSIEHVLGGYAVFATFTVISFGIYVHLG